MHRTLRRRVVLVAAFLVAAQTLPAPSAHLSAPGSARAAALAPATRPTFASSSFSPITFDDFNRTVASGWGTSSSGVAWTDDSLRQNGVTSQQASNAMSVDGLNGRMDLGVQEPIFMRAGSGPWQNSEWTMTSRFKVSAVPGTGDYLQVSFWVFTDTPLAYGNGPHVDMDISSNQSGGFQGQVMLAGTPGDPGTVSIPRFDWQPNVSYTLKWGLTWGGQSKVKVWVTSDPEPATWLLVRDGSHDRVISGASTVLEPMAGFADSATQVWFDDIHFDPGNFFVEPAPPGTTNQENGGTSKDPVSTFSGALLYHHTDISIPGRGPSVNFTRSYNSEDTRSGRLGPGWTDSYNARLADPGDGSSDLLLVKPTGATSRFRANGDGTFSPPAAVYSSLAHNGDGSYSVTNQDQTVWTFDLSGRLLAMADRFGNVSSLTYDASNRLTGVSDAAGRGTLHSPTRTAC